MSETVYPPTCYARVKPCRDWTQEELVKTPVSLICAEYHHGKRGCGQCDVMAVEAKRAATALKVAEKLRRSVYGRK